MSKLTDLGEKLQKALKDAGINYQGQLYLSEEEFAEYKDMSPKEMASRYIRNNDMLEKNKLLIILMEVYDSNKRGTYKYPMWHRLKELGLDNKYYMYIFRHFTTSILKVSGESANTEYAFFPNRKPDFGDTEVYYGMFRTMKTTKLTAKQKEFIDENRNMDLETILDNLEISGNGHRCVIGFKILERFHQLQFSEKKKIVKIPDKEISRRLPDVRTIGQTVPIQEMVHKVKEELHQVEENVQKEEEVAPESYMFLLNAKNELLLQIIKNQEKYISKLEHELLTLKNKSDE